MNNPKQLHVRAHVATLDPIQKLFLPTDANIVGIKYKDGVGLVLTYTTYLNSGADYEWTLYLATVGMMVPRYINYLGQFEYQGYDIHVFIKADYEF